MSAIRNGCLVCLWLCLPLSAAVISGGDAGALLDPGFGDAWNRTGFVGTNGSGVYLGNGWVLTANHVANKNTFTVAGDQTYQLSAGAGNTHILRNPQDTANVDLFLFRIDVPAGSGLDGMGLLPIAAQGPQFNTVGMHIGTGRGQTQATASTWYINTSGQNWIWQTEVFEGADATVGGYTWGDASTRQTRWNHQPVAQTGVMAGATAVFTTQFVQGATAGMAIDNDSGSPFFLSNAENLPVLAGIALSILRYNSQPIGTSMYGNQTVYADLSQYLDQIEAIVIPEAATLFLFSLCGLLAWGLRRRD